MRDAPGEAGFFFVFCACEVTLGATPRMEEEKPPPGPARRTCRLRKNASSWNVFVLKTIFVSPYLWAMTAGCGCFGGAGGAGEAPPEPTEEEFNGR